LRRRAPQRAAVRGSPGLVAPLIAGLMEEAPHGQLPTAGLSVDYVARETKRVVADVNGAIAVYPGIDVGVPARVGERQITPDDVRDAVKAAFGAGAQGVVLSRKYSEMKLANLAGAGQGLREAGVV
jgi:hypothetical protein